MESFNGSKGVSIVDFIKNLTYHKFYGSVELKFENGIIVYVKKTETIKPGTWTLNILDSST